MLLFNATPLPLMISFQLRYWRQWYLTCAIALYVSHARPTPRLTGDRTDAIYGLPLGLIMPVGRLRQIDRKRY